MEKRSGSPVPSLATGPEEDDARKPRHTTEAVSETRSSRRVNANVPCRCFSDRADLRIRAGRCAKSNQSSEPAPSEMPSVTVAPADRERERVRGRSHRNDGRQRQLLVARRACRVGLGERRCGRLRRCRATARPSGREERHGGLSTQAAQRKRRGPQAPNPAKRIRRDLRHSLRHRSGEAASRQPDVAEPDPATREEQLGSRWTIAGHTDNQGGADYNLKLSLARAHSVVTCLTQHGRLGRRLDGEGFRPDAPGC